MAALKNINLDIAAGERLAIIGESGSGKSTLALAIAGLLPASSRVGGRIDWFLPSSPPSGAKAPPSVLPDISPARGEISSSTAESSPTPAIGESGNERVISPLAGEMSGRTEGGVTECQPFKSELNKIPLLGRDIGFVFQDPSASLDPVMTIGKQIAEVARTHLGLTWSQSYAKAKSLLERVRLPDPDSALRAFPHQLSGGQKQRVAIAAAIAAGPKLLIADEATSALDTIVQAEIVALIRRLVTEDGMTLLFISHDIALATELAERIAVFRHGQLVELGTTAQIVGAPAQPYTRALLDAHIGLDAKPLLNRAGLHA
ncbi:MAG: ABC transporter ATP-binding protein [Mesorhizobium sp.]|nr:MAG: ABC transporter ATP-binding protein [Mesorhizobium sp.]